MSNDRTYYLKYRPQKISELDLTAVRESLEKVLKSKKIPHALLFSGPRGTGKTSAARIFAKAINCQTKRKTFEPCNRCKICQGITDGSSLDLIEIDAASNRGIDDVRDLRDKIKLSPAEFQYKVYIIDEVHMLTKEAFNALLKTLEEPPGHAIFILCTTAPEKLPETILSRCLRFNFKKATHDEVLRSLQRVIKGEKLKVEKGVLEEIAQSADGSFRDAQKVLDQLAMGKRKVSLKETKELLGKIEATAPGKLLQLLADRELKSSLLEIDRVVTLGADLSQYCQDILDKFRLGLLSQAGLTEISSPEETAGFNITELTELIRLFSQAAKDLRTSPIPQLPLELAVVEWLRTEKPEKTGGEEERGAEKNLPPPSGKRSRQDGELFKEISQRWQEVLDNVRPLNHSVEALLKASRPANVQSGVLVLEVFYEFHKERLETDKCRSVIEEVASEVVNKPLKLRCVLGKKEKAKGSEKKSTSDVVEIAEEIFGSRAN